MILQNGCNLNWLQPFLNTFCSQCRVALATVLIGYAHFTDGLHTSSEKSLLHILYNMI